MRKHTCTLLFCLWLTFCAVGIAYDASTLHERTASILAGK